MKEQALELRKAVEAGSIAEVTRLLASGTKASSGINDQGARVLHRAAKQSSVQICRLLVEHGAGVNDFDAFGRWPVWEAVAAGALDNVEYLVGAGGRLDPRGLAGRTLLHAAAAGGHARVAEWLLRRGASPDARDETNATPLAVAAMHLYAGLVPLLVPSPGRGEERSGQFGSMPIHLVAQVADNSSRGGNMGADTLHGTVAQRCVATMRALVAIGHDVNARDWHGRTPLHLLRNAAEEVLDAILALGADLEARDLRGDTPLLAFVRPGGSHWDVTTESAELLLAAGARIDHANDRGETPLKFCKSRRLKNLTKMGQAALAKEAARATLARATGSPEP